MCQLCVDDGEMSQEQLDEAVLSGNMDVLPIVDFPRDIAIEKMASVCADLMVQGISLGSALYLMEKAIQEYDAYHAERKS